MVSYTSNFLHFNFISISAFFYFIYILENRENYLLVISTIVLILNWSISYQLYRFLYYIGFYIISWLYRILDFRDNFKLFFSVIRLDYSCLGIQQYSLFHNMSENMILKRNPVKGKKLWILVIHFLHLILGNQSKFPNMK